MPKRHGTLRVTEPTANAPRGKATWAESTLDTAGGVHCVLNQSGLTLNRGPFGDDQSGFAVADRNNDYGYVGTLALTAEDAEILSAWLCIGLEEIARRKKGGGA